MIIVNVYLNHCQCLFKSLSMYIQIIVNVYSNHCQCLMIVNVYIDILILVNIVNRDI